MNVTKLIEELRVEAWNAMDAVLATFGEKLRRAMETEAYENYGYAPMPLQINEDDHRALKNQGAFVKTRIARSGRSAS